MTYHPRRDAVERLVNPERNAVVQTAAYFASVGLAMALTAVLVGIRLESITAEVRAIVRASDPATAIRPGVAS